MNDHRIFSGFFPCGIVYADRHNEVAGDYKRLAFLPYTTLTLEIERDCPDSLRKQIERDAATFQARRGERQQIAGNMSITLGETECKATPFCLNRTIETVQHPTRGLIPACPRCQGQLAA
jgi:hypothetical protein